MLWCPVCEGFPHRDSDSPGGWSCLQCSRWLVVRRGGFALYKREHEEPRENPLEEVLAAAMEAGTYQGAKAILQERRMDEGSLS